MNFLKYLGVVTSPKEIPARETCLRKFLQAVVPKKYSCNGEKNPWTQVGLKKMPAPKIVYLPPGNFYWSFP